MRLKVVLLFSLLFLILVIGLLYYAFPNVLFRLRIDPIPAGAYTVPWMKPNPSINALLSIPFDQLPWNIDAVMAGALKLDMTFRIPVPGQTRVVPSTVYLGHDAEHLYIGGNFSEMGSNPNSNAQAGYPDYFNLLFDVANDGVLTFPESGSEMSVDVSPPGAKPPPQGWNSPLVWWYQELVWRDYIPAVHRAAWDFADATGMTVSCLEGMAVEYDNSTGTLVIICSRHLWKAGYWTQNTLQMRSGERWVMGFLLELGLWNFAGGVPYTDYVDGWPVNTYPYLSNDSSWWPKLVIDLTNPPPTIPGQNPA